MKNNKGFTLVEILAVISLLGVIMVLIIPGILNLVGDSKKRINELEKKDIMESGKLYLISIDENKTKYNDLSGYDFKKYMAENGYITVSLENLIDLKYYDENCISKICRRISAAKKDPKKEKVECNIKLSIDLKTQDGFLVSSGYNASLEGKDCE